MLPAAVAVQRVVRPWPVADNASVAAYVERHRRPDDPVIGNECSHQYYLRRLGPAFWPADDVRFRPRDRLWVVYSGHASWQVRWDGSARLAPPGWQAVERFDALFATATLFVDDAEPLAQARD
jgi:hypothetical protein